MDRRGFTTSSQTLLVAFAYPCFLLQSTMSRPNFFNSNVVYHDNSTEYNIDARGRDLASILRACNTEDIQAEEVTTEPMRNKEYCEYICRERLQEQGLYSLDEFEQMLANATKGIAPDLAAFLKRYKAQGVIDFMGHSKRQIFDNLRKHFPEMRNYDYPNFAAAF